MQFHNHKSPKPRLNFTLTVKPHQTHKLNGGKRPTAIKAKGNESIAGRSGESTRIKNREKEQRITKEKTDKGNGIGEEL